MRIEITLTRLDLVESKKEVKASLLSIFDFKITRKQINKASRIVFKEAADDQEIIFKRRSKDRKENDRLQ